MELCWIRAARLSKPLPQRDGRFPRGEADRRDARIEDGPGGEDGKERQGQGSQAELQRESGGGEPQRTDHTHEVFEANGTAERDAALVMLEQIPGTKHVTVGGDKAYGTADFVAECRNLKVTPHVAQNLERPVGVPSMLATRGTMDMPSVRGRKRKRIAECFGWRKKIALLRKVRQRYASALAQSQLLQ